MLQPQTRFNRARALFQTDQAELAIVELDWLAENLSTPNADVLQFRTLTLAQLGRSGGRLSGVQRPSADKAHRFIRGLCLDPADRMAQGRSGGPHSD
ncbi:MAG UNVERIFIED_CONTAM: hypothetical protein LVR18_43875 [Planctomycetaceae bacterium]